MFVQDLVNQSFQNKRIINGDQVNLCDVQNTKEWLFWYRIFAISHRLNRDGKIWRKEIVLTWGFRYQQGSPLLVIEPSMMSSATKKNACNYNGWETHQSSHSYPFNTPTEDMGLKDLTTGQFLIFSQILECVDNSQTSIHFPCYNLQKFFLGSQTSCHCFSNQLSQINCES